jgi:hypothetical protein
VGAFIEITPTELGLSREDGVARIELERVGTLDRSLGERRRFGRNFLITTGVSALALGILAAATDAETCNDAPFGCLDAGGSFIVGSIFGGIVGAPIGLIVGLAVRSERWEPVTLTPSEGTSLTLMPGAERVSLGVSVPVGPGR